MLSKGIRKYASNPVVGLLPFVVYIIGYWLFDSPILNISIALVFAVIGELLVRFFLKSRIFSTTFHISIIALLLTLALCFATSRLNLDATTYLLICEIIIVSLFMLLRVSKTYINLHFFRQKTLAEKALLNDFYQTATVIQYLFVAHLFILLIDRQLRLVCVEYNPSVNIFFVAIPLTIMVGVVVAQIFNIRRLSLKLRKEEWLPIVTEEGVVNGRIAKSISMTMKNRFLHPIVRVALTSNGKVFLQERKLDNILNPGKFDYPFEKYMLFSHEINLAARNSIRSMMGDTADVSLRFLLKYVFENDDTKRLIFLFVAEVKDENSITRSDKITGKFWSIKQIEEGFVDEVFSECFELEFEYLKNMVLLSPDASSGRSAEASL